MHAVTQRQHSSTRPPGGTGGTGGRARAQHHPPPSKKGAATSRIRPSCAPCAAPSPLLPPNNTHVQSVLTTPSSRRHRGTSEDASVGSASSATAGSDAADRVAAGASARVAARRAAWAAVVSIFFGVRVGTVKIRATRRGRVRGTELLFFARGFGCDCTSTLVSLSLCAGVFCHREKTPNLPPPPPHTTLPHHVAPSHRRRLLGRPGAGGRSLLWIRSHPALAGARPVPRLRPAVAAGGASEAGPGGG